jgi:hypothetical protein
VATTSSPVQDPTDPPAIAAFVARWQSSGSAERANYQLFLGELCDLLAVPRPDPTRPDDAQNAYVFEKSVRFASPDGSHSVGRIDLYKRACFVLEAKQGSDLTDDTPLFGAPTKKKLGTAARGTASWDAAMLKARGQAEAYVRAFPCVRRNVGNLRCRANSAAVVSPYGSVSQPLSNRRLKNGRLARLCQKTYAATHPGHAARS